jgi:hypothetical protein
MESSVVIGAEVKKANLLEKIKAEIEYCEINLGRSFKEVDAARVGAAYEYNSAQVTAITNGLIASKYEAYGDLYKAAEYYYKDYLSETNPKKYWKSKHAWSSPGDFMPFPGFMSTLKQNQDYRKMLKAYPEYFNYSFLGRIKGPNGRKMSKEEEINKLKENMAYDLELKRIYDSFMDEWGVVRKLAKTEDPKPLTPAVQNHEWFYSDKQEEVLKALAYYSQNKVRFMLEKALSHKDPVVAAKAKEYLEELTKGEKNEIENKKH